MLSFLPIFVHKVIQKKQKNNNYSQSTALYFNDLQIFQIHTVTLITIDTQYVFCVLKGVYYTRIIKNACKCKLIRKCKCTVSTQFRILPTPIIYPLMTEYHSENFPLTLTLYILPNRKASIQFVISLGKPYDRMFCYCLHYNRLTSDTSNFHFVCLHLRRRILYRRLAAQACLLYFFAYQSQ